MSGNTIGGLTTFGVDELPPDYGRWLLYGPQGSGKSYLSHTLAEFGKTLFIDITGEKGIRSFAGSPYAANITVVRPTSVAQLNEIFWALNRGEGDYKVVIIDSLTAIQRLAVRFVLGEDETGSREIKQSMPTMDQRMWGQTLTIMSQLAVYWFSLADGQRKNPMHVAMTAQVKMWEDEVNSEVNRQPDVQKGALSPVLASPDYVLYTDTEESGEYDDDGQALMRHIVRFGPHPGYRTKGRVPVTLHGKIPPILGRKGSPNLAQLSRVLGIGGTTPAVKK